MDNKNVQEFLNSLTEEQRAAVLACKTEEDLEKVVDEYDIDLPDEMLADVAGGKGGLLPALMAGIMTLSGGAAVMGTTSAIQATLTSAIGRSKRTTSRTIFGRSITTRRLSSSRLSRIREPPQSPRPL